jgi:hypothetical protein
MSNIRIAHAVLVEARRVACGVKSPKRRFNRTPEMAAVILCEATGGCWSPEEILHSDLPRLMLNNRGARPLFADADILALATRLLDEASVIACGVSAAPGSQSAEPFVRLRGANQ